ncbi:MAG TPA: NAD-dependent epimerase/dehydratase family protein [Anaerolineaceae bacterium]|nr:NAD-dependent epimerase/dehydratase family protein [Anaerolineaceae bacterium]
MARYLVTGAAGFIGSRVTELLLDGGHQVVGVDNLNDAYDPRMKDYRLKRLQACDGFTFQQLDIADRAALERAFDSVDGIQAVINLAARAGVRTSVENPWVYYDTNLTGTLNLLELCRQRQIGKFILASTSSLYGADAPLPTPEDADTNHPLQPYAASKKAAETLSYAYHYLHGIDVTVFRYFTVYGPAGRPDMVMFRFNQWIAEGRRVRLNGDGNQSRGFTYVDDIARGTIAGLKPVGYEVINLGGHELITINELIGMLEELTGRKADVERLPRHPADMQTNYADVSKARQMLGWEPRVSIVEGVKQLVDWYDANRELASQILTP